MKKKTPDEKPADAAFKSRNPSRRSSSFVILHSAFVISLAGCNLAPKYDPPAVALPSHFKTSGPWRQAKPGDHDSRGNWWRLFGDSRLTALMQRAEANSPTLEVAMHKVDEARALARADRAGLFPFVAWNSSVKRSHGSGTLANTFAGGVTTTRIKSTLDLEYELDFWGKLRNQSAAANSKAESAEADHRSVLLTLQGEIALNYFALRSQDAEIALLKRAIELREKAVDLAKARFKQGDTAQLDVAQAETELATARSEAIGLEKLRAELDHAIALLVGTTPAELSHAPSPLSGTPPSVPTSLPSDLLERRPDIAAAERTMAEQNALIGVARAAVFPSVKIGLSNGGETSYLKKLADAASHVWGLGPDVQWPVFDGGKRLAETDAQRAKYLQAAGSYRETVLKAVRDVEDALSGISILNRQAAAQAQTVAGAQKTVELAEKRYSAGLVAYYEVLDAQRTLLRAEQELTRINGEQFLSTVLLIKALGGGW
ncbi:MAG: efflux transporter outer membrane subunit [Verrucomicrobiaceae bacterium]|nr:efflux transporter outer membrane subunit [Verrucomicrobiaceae bacterium]